MISEEKAIECLKLAKSYASKHKNFSRNFDTYEDYVSSLLLKLLTVLNLYDKNKGTFSTFAYAIFSNEIRKIIRDNQCKKRKHEDISLNQLINKEDSNIRLSDVFSEEITNIEEFIEKEEAKFIYKKLSSCLSEVYKQNKIFNVKQVDLACKYKINQATISRRITDEQKIINKILRNESVRIISPEKIRLKNAIEEIKNEIEERKF